jgi:hypothetical protein
MAPTATSTLVPLNVPSRGSTAVVIAERIDSGLSVSPAARETGTASDMASMPANSGNASVAGIVIHQFSLFH